MKISIKLSTCRFMLTIHVHILFNSITLNQSDFNDTNQAGSVYVILCYIVISKWHRADRASLVRMLV